MIPDSEFQSGGIFRRDALINSLDDWATVVKVTNDDKIVVAGTAKTGLTDVNGYEQNEFVIYRFNADGQLDPTFGEGGSVHTAFTTISAKEVKAMAVQSDGKIIVGGDGVILGANRMYAFMLVRYNSNGDLDTGFGTNGLVITNCRYSNEPINFADDNLRSLAILPNGKILAGGGSIVNQPYFPGRAALMRYNPDGSRDNSFGTEGLLTPDTPSTFRAYIESIIPPSPFGDQTFYLGITLTASYGMNSYSIHRLQDDGSGDPTFGENGMISDDRPGYHNNQYLKAIALAPNGYLIALGGSDSWAFWLQNRGTSDGEPIDYFGDNGLVYCDPTYGNDVPGGLIFGIDNKITIGLTTLSNRWSIAKFDLDYGTLDPNFGISFYPITESGYNQQSFVSAIAQQSDGKYILVGGTKYSSTNNWDVMVLRFIDNPEVVTGIAADNHNSLPADFSLLTNYPNPFNPVTTIRYQLPQSGWTIVKVFDLAGQEIQTLVDGSQAQGEHQVEFDASGLSNGIYFCRLSAPGFTATQKMILMK
jgi:uncharacterized delta-60 repeat protein